METVVVHVPDGYEIKVVKKKENENPSREIKTYQDLIDNNTQIVGYWTSGNEINKWSLDVACYNSYDVAKTKKVAKSMRAMAMISQLMPYYGGEITDEEWENETPKYSIIRNDNMIGRSIYISFYHFLSFHTTEQREEFLKYNERLVKDYLMID